MIPLPEKGTAFAFQLNLLTDFSQPGPYNVQLLAKQMDFIIQIPHTSQQDFVTASDKLNFPYLDKIAVMPLADTLSASSPNLMGSSEVLPNNGSPENFV